MPRLLAALTLVCLSTPAWAQLDLGVERTTDDLFGTTSCSQTVILGEGYPTGVSLLADGTHLYVHLLHGPVEASVFNQFGLVGGEKVHIEWSEGTIESLDPGGVEFQPLHRLEVASFIDESLARSLLASRTDVRVQFDGPKGSTIFPLPRELLAALREGFGATCLE